LEALTLKNGFLNIKVKRKSKEEKNKQPPSSNLAIKNHPPALTAQSV
jgi:hypothetical protein